MRAANSLPASDNATMGIRGFFPASGIMWRSAAFEHGLHGANPDPISVLGSAPPLLRVETYIRRAPN